MNKYYPKIIIVFLIVVLVIAASLRLINISQENFSLDEAWSVVNAQHSVSEITRIIQNENYPPLYQYLLHGWLGVFGVSELAARSLSLILGLLSIIVIYLLGKALFSRSVGVWAALLTALSSFHIEFSQEARMYILVFLLSGLSSLFLWRALKIGQLRHWILYIVISALNLYTHYFAILLLVSQFIFIVVYVLRNRGVFKLRRNYLISLLAIVILFLPEIPNLINRFIFHQKGFWLQFYSSDVGEIVSNIPDYFFLHWRYGQSLDFFRALAPLYYVVIIVLFGLVFYRLGNKIKQYYENNLWPIVFLVCLVVVPVIISLLLDMYFIRYLIIILPALYVWLAQGLRNFKNRYTQVVIIVIMVIILIPSWAEVTKVHYDWGSVGQYIENNEPANGIIILYSPMHSYLFDYYYKGSIERVAFFPLAGPAGRNNELEIIKYSGFMMINSDTVNQEMSFLIKKQDRVWLVDYQQPILDRENLINRWLSDNYNLNQEESFPYRFEGENLTLKLYER
ncbi:glycosyltransferase family 39 protein [Patescibacteria group bacterium]|nr:glycosyltransferase family 39 protein [Patescibacteria group bacterium]MBU0964297.1 glycosyltransferase family 39 protein [Patescibacteria group bacterium]